MFSAATCILVVLTATEHEVMENFTGRVLEGSNDRLTRIEKKPAQGRRPASVVVLKDCGPLAAGSIHEFGIWAGGWEDVRPCLAVNGKPPEPVSRKMPAGSGVLYGQLVSIDAESSKRIGGVEVTVTCGQQKAVGKADARGRFWTMLPAGHCWIGATVDGYRVWEGVGQPVQVREGMVEAVLVKLQPWGWLDRAEALAGRLARKMIW